jgi:hypothetical protein
LNRTSRFIVPPITILSASALAAMVACGSKNQDNPPQMATAQGTATYGPQQYPPGQYPQGQQPGQYPQQYPTGQQPQQYPTQQPTGYPTQQPTQQPTATQPTGLPTGLPTGIPSWPTGTGTAPPQTGGGGGSATVIDPSVAGAAAMLLTSLAGTEAPGMNPEQNAIAGQFSEGQTLEQTFTLAQGKCYTIVAASVGITEVDLQIVANAPLPPIPGLSPVLQSDSGSSTATLGGASKGGCWHWIYPIGLPAKWVLKAGHGGGLAIGRLYSK